MKKATIVVVILVVLCLIAGVATYMALRQTSSQSDLVKSMNQMPGVAEALHPSWSPDGLTIVYESWNPSYSRDPVPISGIWTIDSDGGNRTFLSEGEHPIWSPEGSSIAFVTDNGLEVMSRDGSERKILVNMAELVIPGSEHTDVGSTAWSPDGSMIAFGVGSFVPDPSDEWEQWGRTGTSLAELWIVNADGSNPRQLTSPSAGYAHYPVWSPDSLMIAFILNKSGSATDIWVTNTDGSELQQLTNGPERDSNPSWSPDGSKIAFSSGEDDPDIWVMDADGGNKTQLTTGSACYGHPTWSPDGSLIAFDSLTHGPVGNIWIMNADGTAITKLTKSSWSRFTCQTVCIRYEEPRWSPDGTMLLFTNGITRGERGWGHDRLWVLELEQEDGELG